ncbi:MAG: hypothetical protein A3G33_07405 [Omnitrophica bacterium RIFCSPLOWO2_12_FULL_44_17]|uniref:Acriflavin resistance protein n=1 Tax=Candidatus Danuiimicrobium aquiferis TaxID=1801832 RepID=A0A1G1KYS0_9BACT|nr:MAG: hypothetical protein A3B72_07705 [Omnitrophica bacterium RIFCSPHIGHO2_02_FULL_45_28]OGW88467.1 MAG: hypothetical protein A3E74_06680 [Omnitrophica bacterium RIFCSPHIGHO2_12_FULL_44_12]OGW98050.1 MAG: hypothetical protein A3G33_07405 [Omnitrophica bacterium RIFCSPLOWO2_12_FULL_44_17]OGX03507.1 MAG: hypothetical protein A3J12_02825 [Omnitrophica bacterium RIFCSPLOWO2_02_FULL_44_11]
MGLPTVASKKPVLTAVIFACLLMLGCISLYLLPIELYQGSGRGIISVIIRARGGLPPLEMERMITRLVEESVSTVSHLKTMYSNSRESESRVTLEFEVGTDMKFAALEVREKFSRVKGLLPSEIEKPVIANYQDSDSAVLIVAIVSETMSPEDIRSMIDQELKPVLDRVNGVASVEVYGGRERKILVELDRDKMFAYNISIERVMDVIGASNVALLAGSYERGGYDFAIRTMGMFTSIDEIGSIGVKATRQGSIIPLSEIATIKDAYLEPEDYARLNLSPNVSVYVKKVSTANTIQISDAVQKTIQGFMMDRKEDLHPIIISDKAKLIKRAINDVRDSLLIAIILVFAIIYVSLRRTLISLIVTSTIPVSIVATFFFMDRLGFSINVMTLSGLTLSIGIMVDSAVVVVENIVRKQEDGIAREEAIVNGAEEMFVPLLASLFCSLCVFVPIVIVDQQIRLTYAGFIFTVCSALIIALLSAVMLVPLLLLKTNALDAKSGLLGTFSSYYQQTLNAMRKVKFINFMIGQRKEKKRSAQQKYSNLLSKSFKIRYPVLIATVLLLVFSLWRLLILPMDLPSQLEENEFQLVVFPLAGAKLEANDEAARKLEELLHEYPDVELISTTVQKDDLRLFVRLVPRAKRKVAKEVIMDEVKKKGEEMIKQIHDEYSLIVDQGASSEESKKMIVNIFGLENDTLEKLAHEAAQKMSSIKGLTNLVMTDLRKRPEYSVVIDKAKAAFYGLTVREVADSIHAQVRGMRPTKYHELKKGIEIETITRLQPIYRQKIEDLNNIYIVSPKDGTQVRISQIAGLVPSRGPQTIDRKDKYRYVYVKGDVTRPLEAIAKELKETLKGIKFPKDYFWRFGGAYEDLMKGKSKLALGVLMSIVLVYMVLASLYQSYTQPMMIMMAIPLGVIGVWAILAFSRKYLSEQVFIGMVILVGYVVNSSIILIDRINHLKKDIPDVRERLVKAARDRFRPILITSLSTIIGFMPMAFSQSESSELWAPLALTMIGGIISSTFLTLFIVPNFYLYFEDLKNLLKKKVHL